MSLRVPGSHPGVNSPQQVNSTPQVDDPSIAGAEPISKKKTSKKGIADFNDSFEATPQGLQHPQPNAQQLPAVQNTQQAEQAKAGAADAASNNKKTYFADINERMREHIDETGYKWTSWRFEPPSVKQSEGIDEDPFKQQAMDRLAEMWKDAAEKAQFANIRA